MTQPPTERLYQLLPAIYRIRDEEVGGEPLRALLAVLEEELEFLEIDIDNLYDNWFIETCDDWVVPYIGDLLGARELYPERAIAGGAAQSLASQPGKQDTNSQLQRTHGGQLQRRAYVANILAYRRRKGTVPVLEQLARDITGWPARAVEFFQLVAATANLDLGSSTGDSRAPIRSLVNLRSASRPELSGTPFEKQASYTAEVRRIASSRGRYNLSNLGLFLWRLSSYPLEKATAFPANLSPELQGRCYTFSPLGSDQPLFNLPQTETEIIHLAQEINVPGKLPTRQNYEGYSNPEPVIKIFVNGQPRPIPPEEVLIAPLAPPSGEDKDRTKWQIPTDSSGTKVVAVDPERGRLAFLDRNLPSRVEVSYAYGFSGDIGGGPYERIDQPIPPLTWQVTPTSSAHPNPLAEVIQIWNGTVRAWQGIRDLTCLPLAYLSIRFLAEVENREQGTGNREQKPIKLNISLQDRSSFKPGIIIKGGGLSVIAKIGSQEVLVTPGVAVDGQGRTISLDRNYSVKLAGQNLNLSLLPSQEVLLVIAYRSASEGENYQIRAILKTEEADYPEARYLRLARLSVDPQGKILSSPDPTSRLQFKSGIVSGFQVVTNPGTLEAIVTPGTAVDGQGRGMELDRNVAVTAADLSQYPGQNRLLLLSYSATATANWQLQHVAESEANRYPEATYLRLANLEDIPEVTVTASNNNIPRFRQGIVSGLAVTAAGGTREATVAAGVAANAKGQRITIESDYRIPNLWRYRNQKIVTVALFPISKRLVAQGKIMILQAGQEKNYPECLPLANLTLDAAGKVTAASTNLSSQFQPGIVEGLAVRTAGQAQVTVSAGRAVDSQGQPIILEQECQVDLSAHPGRELILFISQQRGMGWQQLAVTRHGPGRQWQQLGAVPQEPTTDESGIILIRDNRTYEGNLEIEIPSDRQLQILAANGYRPHIRGDVSVQSSDPPETDQAKPSKLIVDGLLIEGKLTVAAGYLQKLRIAHCTLVPNNGGLTVKRTEPASEPDQGEEEWFLIALTIYYLNLIQQLIRLGITPDGLSPQQRLQQLVQLACQELQRFFSGCQQAIIQWQNRDKADSDWFCQCLQLTPPSLPGADNADLSLEIDRSICGPIHLAETVPKLAIADSIIDKGTRKEGEDPRPVAILALGTDAELRTATILGMTAVGKISASDCLFSERVAVRRRQEGCLRFCLVPDGSQTPRRYQCQPDLLLVEESRRLPADLTSLVINGNGGQIFAGTAGDGIFRSLTNGESWQQLNNHLSNQHVTSLITYTKSASGTIASNGLQVTGEGTAFKEKLRPSDLIIAMKPNQNNTVDISPIKTITEIISDTQLTIDEAFNEENWQEAKFFFIPNRAVILAGTLGDGILYSEDNGNNWLPTKLTQKTIQVLALAPDSSRLLAGTPEGVFESAGAGGDWSSLGKLELNVTALAATATGEIFAGTPGNGIFRLSPGTDDWEAINQGLTDREVTVMGIGIGGEIFAGTEGGAVFRSKDKGETWELTTLDWMNWPVTSLAIKTVTGVISSQGLTVTGSNTTFNKDLLPGCAIAAAGQVRTVKTIESETKLTLDTAFRPDLPEGTAFSNSQIFIGTAGGGIFCYLDGGKVWRQVNHDWTSLTITTLTINVNTGEILAGTAAGSLICSTDSGRTWQAVNSVSSDVDKKLLLLNRLHPTFTSRDYGDPGYAQLSQSCAIEIRTGAEDGSEMGAFNYLNQPQREASLKSSLQEYLPFGMEAGIFYIT